MFQIVLIALIYIFCFIVTKYLPAIPVPPQSVIIKRYKSLQARPGKILSSAFFSVLFFATI